MSQETIEPGAGTRAHAGVGYQLQTHPVKTDSRFNNALVSVRPDAQ